MFSYVFEIKSIFFKFTAVCTCVNIAGMCYCVDNSTVTKSKQETKTNILKKHPFW